MRLENYQVLHHILKVIPSLHLDDQRLPATIKKVPKSFADMLHDIEFCLGQCSGRLVVEVHHDLFAYAAGGPFEYEIAKLDDDSYLIWHFAHNPMAQVKPLFSDQICAFRLETDPAYSCGEKALTVCPEGFCLFHTKKSNTDDLAKRMGGVLWEAFKTEYESRVNEYVRNGGCDFRGWHLIGWLSECLQSHTFAKMADFSDAFLSSVEFDKSVFSAGARFDRTVFDWTASFRETLFQGEAIFNGAKFQRHGLGHNVWFANTVFQHLADFTNVDFTPEERPFWRGAESSIRMETVQFQGGVSFNEAKGLSFIRVEDARLRDVLDKEMKSQRGKNVDAGDTCPGSAEAYYQEGMNFLNAHELPKAAQAFMKALGLDRGKVQYWNNLGATYWMFVQQNMIPNVGPNHIMMVLFFDQSERVNETAKSFVRPLVDESYINDLKRCLTFSEACLNRAVQLEHGDPGPARSWRAMLYRATGRMEQAKADLELVSVRPSPWKAAALETLRTVDSFDWNWANRVHEERFAAAVPIHEIFGNQMRLLLSAIDSFESVPKT